MVEMSVERGNAVTFFFLILHVKVSKVVLAVNSTLIGFFETNRIFRLFDWRRINRLVRHRRVVGSDVEVHKVVK